MTRRPSAERVMAASAAAALAPAAVAAALALATSEAILVPAVFVAVFLVALVHVVFLALPLFLLLALRWRATLVRVLIASFLIGAGPVTLMVALETPGVDLESVPPLLFFGGFGLCGGLAFGLAVAAPEREPGP